jgi:hypothetical protein
MTQEYEVFKCMTLIRMLVKRHQNPERALEVYTQSVYNRAMNKLESLKQRRLEQF